MDRASKLGRRLSRTHLWFKQCSNVFLDKALEKGLFVEEESKVIILGTRGTKLWQLASTYHGISFCISENIPFKNSPFLLSRCFP